LSKTDLFDVHSEAIKSLVFAAAVSQGTFKLPFNVSENIFRPVLQAAWSKTKILHIVE
jgi:hypothetical protein